MHYFPKKQEKKERNQEVTWQDAYSGWPFAQS